MICTGSMILGGEALDLDHSFDQTEFNHLLLLLPCFSCLRDGGCVAGSVCAWLDIHSEGRWSRSMALRDRYPGSKWQAALGATG